MATFSFFLDKDKRDTFPKRVHYVVYKNSTTNRIQNLVVLNVNMCRNHTEKNWPYSASSAWILTVYLELFSAVHYLQTFMNQEFRLRIWLIFFFWKHVSYVYIYAKNFASEFNWFAFKNTEHIPIHMPSILSQNLGFFCKYTAYAYIS